ncbi:MAG: toll/interleukin-1 receptor domain-containing protein [Actinomycetota bacterium]|nr:toll/interleukin-1 receptor domain-containing protein [Actinomycetota bacterium]
MLLYLLGRQNLVVWRAPDEFVALRPPDTTTMSGDRPAVRLQWLDRWWDMLVVWVPPFSALLLVVPLVFVPTLLLPALLLVMATVLYSVAIMTAPVLYGLLWLCRRLAGMVSDQHEAGTQLIEQNWSMSLCHVTDPSRTEDVLRAARNRVGKLVPAAESSRTQGPTATLVWNERCITTSAARDAASVAAEVTRIAETGVDLLILREPGDESVPRVGVYLVDPVRFLGLFFVGIAGSIAYQAHIVSDQERAACGAQCDGRPASYGDALYWLLSHLVLRGDPGDLSPATAEARLIGLTVTLLGVTMIGVIVAVGVQAARTRKKNAQELDEKVRHSLESSAKAAWGSVFINYRQGVEGLAVAGLYRILSDRFGSDKVFLDIRSMPPGTRYPDELRAKLDASKVVLAVIQQDWLDRLEEHQHTAGPDWVRYEISTALRTGKTVIPVLLNDATLPTASELPADMADLVDVTHRQRCRLRWTSLDEDLTRLVAAIEPHLRIRG